MSFSVFRSSRLGCGPPDRLHAQAQHLQELEGADPGLAFARIDLQRGAHGFQALARAGGIHALRQRVQPRGIDEDHRAVELEIDPFVGALALRVEGAAPVQRAAHCAVRSAPAAA